MSKLLFFIINTAGVAVSYLLIRQEKRQSSNRLIQKFCKAGTHVDCNTVTQSRYSKLLGVVSYSEMGMAYFAAVVLWLAVAPLSSEWVSPLRWFLLASLPITVWSLFTQAFLIRKWCLFCCTIVVLLWINVGILSIFTSFSFSLPVVESLLMALLFLVCIAAVMYVGKTGKSDNPYSEQRETARFKYNFKTLQSQLSETNYETGNIGFVWDHPQATHEIALYVSISCSHCDRAIKEMRRLADIYPDFGYRLIFSVNSDNVEDKANAVVRYFFNLYQAMDRRAFFDMLDAWYTGLNKNMEALQQAFPVLSVQTCQTEMDTLCQFHQQSKISYTPAILLNGRLLSQLYSYKDMFGIVRTIHAEEE